MKKFPWFLSFELGARQACDRRHRTMGTVHSGKISHLTWTFTKKYWAVLGCTGLYWAVLGHLRYLLGNVQVKWRILPLCNGGSCKHENSNLSNFMSFPPQSAEADSVKVVFMKKLNVIFLRFPDLPSADLTLISESSSNTN